MKYSLVDLLNMRGVPEPVRETLLMMSKRIIELQEQNMRQAEEIQSLKPKVAPTYAYKFKWDE